MGRDEHSVVVPPESSIAVTGSGVCYVTPQGALHCGGDNRHGQLGQAGVESLIGATAVPGLPATTKITKVSMGARHICALTHDGHAWCWGRAVEGQLGHAVAARREAPVRADLQGVTSLVAGGDRTCARTDAGWHCSGFAEGDTCGRATLALAQQGLPAEANVVLGPRELCALMPDATLRCDLETSWDSYSGSSVLEPRQSRVYLTDVYEDTKAAIAHDRGVCRQARDGKVACGDDEPWKPRRPVSGLAGGAWMTCGLQRDGKVACKGLRDEGAHHLAPGHKAVQFDAWGTDVCGVDAAGRLSCAGFSDFDKPPVVLTIEGAPTKVAKVAVGDELGCTLDPAGAVACWALSEGVPAYYRPITFAARPMSLPEPATDIVTGRAHACALTASGHVYCWGDNEAGQLGDGTAACEFTPADRTAALTGG